MPRKMPAFQFYVGDWLKCPELSVVSPAARGVWIDLLCLMWESEDRGKLVSGGKPWTDKEIVAAVRGNPRVVQAALERLTFCQVCERDVNGALTCRRMVREEKTRVAGRGRVRKHRTGADVTVEKQNCNTASSSSVSTTNQPTRASPAVVGGLVGGGLADKDSQDPVIEALTRAGVAKRNRLTLADLPGLTAEIIDRVDWKVRFGRGDTGAVVDALKAESERILAKGRVVEKRKVDDGPERERLKTLYAKAEAEERVRHAEVDHE